MPAVAYGILRHYSATKQSLFSDTEIKHAYRDALRSLKKTLGHDVHIGAKYEDAYGMRMSRYGFLNSVGHLRYELATVFAQHANSLCEWIPERIKLHIDARIGIIPKLADASERLSLAGDTGKFLGLIEEQLAVGSWHPNMSWVIARLVAYIFVLAGSGVAIWRWGFKAVVLSIPVGWLIIWIVFRLWPAKGWDEDAEDWPFTGWLLLSVWCLPIYLWAWARNRFRQRP